MNICVFCAASDVDEVYAEPARELAKLIAKQGHTFVWGGSDRGLMKVSAEAAMAEGGRTVGVTMEQLKHTAHPRADIMLVARDLAERKKIMLENSDAIVTVVGGTGTLDEMTELFELKRHGVHHKPLIILNTNGYYNGLKEQYSHMAREGFLNRLPEPIDKLIQFVDTPNEVMDLLADPTEFKAAVPVHQWVASAEAV